MKKYTTARTLPAALDECTLIAAAGGNDDDWCGTRVPGIPLPRPELVTFNRTRFDVDIVIGSRTGFTR